MPSVSVLTVAVPVKFAVVPSNVELNTVPNLVPALPMFCELFAANTVPNVLLVNV